MTTTMSRCFSFILLMALHAQADTLLGRVVSVADGDTITVLDDTHTYADHPQIEDGHPNIAKSYPEGMARELQPA